MKKILIIQQPVGNRGDESAHRGFMSTLTEAYPDCKITVLFFNRLQKDVNEFIVKHPNISYKIVTSERPGRLFIPLVKLYAMGRISLSVLSLLPSVRRIIKYYKQADYIVGAPGGINLGGFQDWIYLAMFNIAKDLNCNLAYFARSIGPFSEATEESALFKKKCEELFKYFSVLSLRDDKSIELAKNLSLNAIETIDSAFLGDKIACDIPSQFEQDVDNSEYIVFVPNCLVWHYRYKSLSLDNITTMWAKLLDRFLVEYPTKKIVMLPQTTGYCESVPDGYIFFNKIKALSSTPDRVVVLDERYGSDIQQRIISKSKLLVGARYHSIVFAINQGIPFVSLTYEHKMSGFLSMIGLSANQINIEKALIEDKIDESVLIDEIMDMSAKAMPIVENRAKIIASEAFDSFFKKLFEK